MIYKDCASYYALIGQFKTLAEYDYFVLGEGIETEGAPDFGLELEYPVKLVRKPFWVNWSTLEFQDFKLWTWIQGSIALERPLGEKDCILVQLLLY